MRKHLLYGLLALRMGITYKTKRSLDQGDLHIKPCKVSYRGVPAWLKLGTLCTDITAKAALACLPRATMFSDRRRIGEFWLSCSVCSIRKDVQRTTLFFRGKWATVKCLHCLSSHSARLWQCVCGIPWHGCATHACRGFACRARLRRACRCSSASKRDSPGPSNLCPIPSLLAPPLGISKRPASACDIRSHGRVVVARAVPSRARKRTLLQSQASDLEAVTRLKDARSNPILAESGQISAHRREKSQGDATPPPAHIHIEILADSMLRPLRAIFCN